MKKKFTKSEIKLFYKTVNEFNLEFKLNGNEKQKRALQILLDTEGKYNEIEEVGLGGGAGGSKTFTGIFWQWYQRVQYAETHSFWGRKKLKDVRGSMMATYNKFCRIYKVPEILQGKLDGQDNVLYFPNGSLIRFLELEYKPGDPENDRFGSYEYTDGFIEESQQIELSVVETLQTRVGRQMNAEYNLPPRILETFNPSKGHIYRRFWLPSEYKDNDMPGSRIFIRSLATDNHYNTEQYLNKLKYHKSLIIRQRLFYGNFDYDDTPGKLFEYDDLQDLATNPNNFGEKCIVCDPARQGRDTAIITVWNGMTPIAYAEYKKSTNDVLEAKIREFSQRYKINMKYTVVDEDGLGGGIVDHLKCLGFVNNSSPIDTRTANEKRENRTGKPNYGILKDQAYSLLSDHITEINTRVFPDRIKDRIIEELDAISQIDIDKDWPFRIIRKDDIKKVLGYSPDWADNFAMRMFLLLKPKKKKALIISG